MARTMLLGVLGDRGSNLGGRILVVNLHVNFSFIFNRLNFNINKISGMYRLGSKRGRSGCYAISHSQRREFDSRKCKT